VQIAWGLVGGPVTKGRLVRLILASGWGRFPDFWSVRTKRPKSTLHILSYPVDLLWAKSTEVLSCLVRQVLRLCWIRSSGGIFWKVFRRSCGLPTRLVGTIDRSASLLVGRTHLSGTVMSLVGGDPGVPMSHTYLVISWLEEHSLPQDIALTSPHNKPVCNSNIRNFGRPSKADVKCPFCFPFPMHPVSVTTIIKGILVIWQGPPPKWINYPRPRPFPTFYSSPRHLKSFIPHFTFPPHRQPISSPPLLHRLKSTAHSMSPSPIFLCSSSGDDRMALGGNVVRRKYLEQGTMFSSSVQLPQWICTCVFSHVTDPMCALIFFIR
jgi:hypothetical protein